MKVAKRDKCEQGNVGVVTAEADLEETDPRQQARDHQESAGHQFRKQRSGRRGFVFLILVMRFGTVSIAVHGSRDRRSMPVAFGMRCGRMIARGRRIFVREAGTRADERDQTRHDRAQER